jgi:hypothetical protein
MRRHLWWLIPFTGMLLILGAILPIVVPRPSPVTRAVYERIKKGMTEAEVEEILGGPPGDYATRPRQWTYRSSFLFYSRMPTAEWDHWKWEKWDGDDVTVWVDFHRRDVTSEFVVDCMRCEEVQRLEVGPVELLRWRFDRWRARVFGVGP